MCIRDRHVKGKLKGDCYACFFELYRHQPSPYAIFLQNEEFAICSLSPELFFSVEKQKILLKPMKGTAPRGLYDTEDKKQYDLLFASQKDRAENVMIVDMIRNDIGKVAMPGTVNVLKLFEIEAHPTIWQMTSTITAKTTGKLKDLLFALFPCASITGAPKCNTMRIIKKLERIPRGLYTGTIGYITPSNKMHFNVAIRTLTINRYKNTFDYGVGGGIIWDSDPVKEYQECVSKVQILKEKWDDFTLLETLRWEPKKGYYLLKQHLQRLRKSAFYFKFPYPYEKILHLLSKVVRYKKIPCIIRLLLARNGRIKAQWKPLPARKEIYTLKLASKPIDETNLFLYHKTTNRKLYDTMRSTAKNVDDVLLYNSRGEITETTIGNIVVEINNQLITPPISSGLLPGVYREYLISKKRIIEKVVKLNDLCNIKKIYVINSVRGFINARLIWGKQHN